jgi:ketosteroid isomerase-like protein
MSWLVEHPFYIAAIGFGAIVILGGSWIKTGRRVLLYLLGAAIALTVALLAVERLVVTDREAVQDTLYQMARDVEKNDLRLVLSHVHEDAERSIVEQAEYEFPRQTFKKVKIWENKLEIAIHSERNPPEATAKFFVTIEGDFWKGQYPSQTVLLDVTVNFRQDEDGNWKLVSYSYKIAELFKRRTL